MADESQEKTLPASEKKLQDARRKGQVAHSKDLVSAVVFLGASGHLLASWRGVVDQLRQLIDVVGDAPMNSFADAWRRADAFAGHIVLGASASFAIVIIATALVSGVAATFGPVFAFEAIQPKLEHIDPMKGLKRIASLKNLVEIVKMLGKLAVITPAAWFILRDALDPLIETPACGILCLGPVLLATVKILAAAAAVAFVAIGLVDLIIQRQLFLREMRMTQAEFKREHKDMEGDPHVRGEQRRLRHELAGPKLPLGLRNAVVAVADKSHFVGLRYVPGELGVPLVVCKGRGENAAKMRDEARRRSIPVVDDAALAVPLFGHAVGRPIRRDLFDAVAGVLLGAGIGAAQ